MDVIVVASSEEGIQETLRVLLGNDHLLIPAYTLPQLLDAVTDNPADAVIIDEFLENIDCVTVFQRLRSMAPETTCIMLAVQTKSEIAREMRARGIYDVIAKPFDKDALRASIDRALERTRLKQQLKASRDARAQARGAAIPSRTSADAHLLAQRREMFDSLRRFLKAVTDILEPERLYGLVLDAVVEIFALNRAVLLLYNDETRELKIKATVGVDAGALGRYDSVSWSGIISWLRKHDQVLDLDNPALKQDAENMLDIRKELELLQTRLCVPLAARGRLTGMLAIGTRITGKALSEVEMEFLYLLAQQVAAIIENARRHRTVSAQKQQFEEILQGVTSGLMATDSEGRLIMFNKAAEKILGLDASDVMGENIQRVGSIFSDIVFRTLRNHETFCRHEIVYPATGARLGISTSLLTGSGGHAIGAVVLFADLSSAARLVDAPSEETWQRCALCLAQEIKNPLVAIRTFTQLFPESYADEKFREEFSTIALQEIDKLDGIVERLLRFSQPLEMDIKPDDLHSALEEELDTMTAAMNEKRINLQKNFELSNGRIPFDKTLLKEALAQIFDNAVEAMPSGGTLAISTGAAEYSDTESSNRNNGLPSGPVVEISIADTGAGIPDEELPSLFKPFHTNKVKGMGLGLAISRRIVRKHKGDILVSSEPNKGTTVKVVLPQGAT
jgi:nitrogen-specific signal transduction histidine kinase/DNA-binding response OmpR family regulator